MSQQGNLMVHLQGGKLTNSNEYVDYIVPSGILAKDLPEIDHVMYIKGLEVEVQEGTEVLTYFNKPYFDRTYEHYCSHRQTQSSGKRANLRITKCDNVIYFSSPIYNVYWSVNSIKNILMQPIYTGDMVQGRSYSYNHKIRKSMPLPKEQWTVVANTHEPIIDKVTFERVQSLINKHSCPTKRKHNTQPSILAGYLVCKKCGRKMQRSIVHGSNKKYYNFLCSAYKKLGTNACSLHLIGENVVLDILLITINTIIKSIVDIEQAVIRYNAETINRIMTKTNHELCTNKAELDKIQSLKVGLYSDYKQEILSLEDYKEMRRRFEDKESQLNEKILLLEDQIKALKNGRGLDGRVINLYKNYKGIDKLNREIVGNLVNEIVVDSNRNIEINFRFNDVIKQLL